MRLLVLGGTWFLGRTVAEAALARGWRVTCFNRGRIGRDVPGVESIRGDRTVAAEVAQLVDRGPWDAVVDASAYEPSQVRATTGALRGVVDQYVLVSTVSAYQRWPHEPVSEASLVWPPRPEAREAGPSEPGTSAAYFYGELKAGCERVVVRAFGDAAVILRPGVLLGPYEYVGRLPALLHRARLGGGMLAAGAPDQPIQPIDVRDLTEFTLTLIEAGRGGAFNVTAPRGHATYGDLIDACVHATGSGAEPVWIPSRWLIDRGVRQWTEIPLWLTSDGAWAVDSSRAREAGLVCRPLRDTVRDTWAWLRAERPVPHERRAEHGMAPERESELLAAWEAERAPVPILHRENGEAAPGV